MTPPFPRTVCACAHDMANCRKMPGYLSTGDVERLATYLEQTPAQLLASGRLEEGRGAVVMQSWTGRTFRIRTIRPTLTASGCTFLTAEGRCAVHAAAPFGCAYFDVHMGPREAGRRSAWGLAALSDDRRYSAYLAVLAEKKEQAE